MIKISPPMNGYRFGFIMDGHAEQGVMGTDIVCAAISAISQATINALHKHGNVKRFEHKSDGGYYLVELDDFNLETLIIMDTFTEAMIILSAQYPEAVNFKGGIVL